MSTKQESLKPIEGADRLNAIINAISDVGMEDLERFNAWSDLNLLSSKTIFEGIEPHPDGIFQSGKDRFEAIATVYVTLKYGGKKDATSMSDSYPAKVTGQITGNKIKIHSISVDTSSFYE